MAHFKTTPGTEEIMVVGTSHIESLPGTVAMDRVLELQTTQLNLAMHYFDQCANTAVFAGDLNVSDEHVVQGLRESWGWSDPGPARSRPGSRAVGTQTGSSCGRPPTRGPVGATRSCSGGDAVWHLHHGARQPGVHAV
ncbi:unnamed protein product [Prorocentrum cordatum]|uniref:Sphingomyelin phosphodiesterase n=1 Tax=Prorocentrum cordatum TaxID=2364126 RepID=A0ABN9QB18_9DINO|nr:unnamed protein product [Polarella glacialis]